MSKKHRKTPQRPWLGWLGGFLIIFGLLFLLVASISPRHPEKINLTIGTNVQENDVVAPIFQAELTLPVDLHLEDISELDMTLMPLSFGKGVEWTEARLEVPGVELQPAGEIRAPNLADRPVSYHWQITAKTSGPLKGELWLVVLGKLGDDEVRLPLLVRSLEWEVVSVMGFPYPFARYLGIGLVLAGLLGLIVQFSHKQLLR